MTINTSDAPTGRASLHATTGRLAAVATALLLVLFLVLSVSRAAFTIDTVNPGNSVSASGISLTDNDDNSAMYAATNVDPTTTLTHCINVTYTGGFDVPPVHLYVPTVAPGALAQYLNVKVELGVADSLVTPAPAFSTDCTGFVPDVTVGPPTALGTIYDGSLAAIGNDYATGITAWDPAATETRPFRFTVTVGSDPTAAGTSALWDFTWETQG